MAKWILILPLCLALAAGCDGVSGLVTDLELGNDSGTGTNEGATVGNEPTGTGDTGDTTDNPDTTTPEDDETGDDVMILPESIRLDVDELNNTDQSAQSAPEPSLEYIDVAQEQAENTLSQLDEITLRFSIINDMVDDETESQFEGTINWDTRVEGATPDPGETRLPNPGAGTGEERNIKVDFTAFDYDGDGTDDGSGLPTVEPVAIRVWVTDADGDYQPAMCGLITTLPTDSNAGAGEMITLSYARNDDGDIAIIEWDQTDEENMLLMTWDEHPQPPDWGYSSFMVQHQEVDGKVEKTVKSSIDVEFVAARYYEDATAAAVRGYRGEDFEDAFTTPPDIEYVDIETHAEATATDADNVSTDDLELMELPETDWFAWPDDFPTSPTF